MTFTLVDGSVDTASEKFPQEFVEGAAIGGLVEIAHERGPHDPVHPDNGAAIDALDLDTGHGARGYGHVDPAGARRAPPPDRVDGPR